jgi:hypothetical protein
MIHSLYDCETRWSGFGVTTANPSRAIGMSPTRKHIFRQARG